MVNLKGYSVKGNGGKGRQLANTIANRLQKVHESGVDINPFRFGCVPDYATKIYKQSYSGSGVCLRGGLVIGKVDTHNGYDERQIADELGLSFNFVRGMESGFMDRAHTNCKVASKKELPPNPEYIAGYRIGIRVFNNLVKRGVPVKTS